MTSAFTVLDHHRAQLRASGLHDETIKVAKLFSVTDPDEAGDYLNWKGEGPVPSIGFFQFGRNGKVRGVVLRPDSPRRRSNGTTPKYESPVGEPPHLYFPPEPLVPAEAWLDPGRPLLLVEGIKKALCAAQAEATVISAQGTTVWHDIQHRRDTDEHRLHPEFAGIPLEGREVFIGFDGGDTTNNAHVIGAEARLASMLTEAGAKVRLLRIPHGGGKVGLDDYLATQTDPRSALATLYKNAINADPLDRAAAVQSRQATLALTKDLSFHAALKVGTSAQFDLVASALKSHGISRKALMEGLEKFKARLRPDMHHEEDADHAEQKEHDPALLQEAEALLLQPDLKERFVDSLRANGLVGEEAAAMTILLAAISRKHATPIHVALKAASSSGKNHLVSAVMEHLPQDEVMQVSAMTPRALFYRESLNGKVIVLAENEGAERAEYSLRLAMSEQSLTLWSAEPGDDGGPHEGKTRKVECRASFITTTTRASIHDENETRMIEIGLDESSKQTERIMMSQAQRVSRGSNEASRRDGQRQKKVWQIALSRLDATEFVIPDAMALATRFPRGRVRARRDFPRLLALAGAHATLHQRQRDKNSEGAIIVTQEDLDAISHLCPSLWSDASPRLHELHHRLADAFHDRDFTAAEAARALGHATDAARRTMNDLVRADLAVVTHEGRGRMPGQWRVCSSPGVGRPTLTDLDTKSVNEKGKRLSEALTDSQTRTEPLEEGQPAPAPHDTGHHFTVPRSDKSTSLPEDAVVERPNRGPAMNGQTHRTITPAPREVSS